MDRLDIGLHIAKMQSVAGIANLHARLVRAKMSDAEFVNLAREGDENKVAEIAGVSEQKAHMMHVACKQRVIDYNDKLLHYFMQQLPDLTYIRDANEVRMAIAFNKAKGSVAKEAIVDDLISYEEKMRHKPFVIDEVTWASAPQSIVSDELHIAEGEHATQFLLVNHNYGNIIRCDARPVYLKEDDWSKTLEDKLKLLQNIVLWRLFHAGVEYNGHRYVFLTSSPGQLKKGSAYLMDVEVKKELDRKFLAVYHNRIKLVITKFLQVIYALNMSSCKPQSQYGFTKTGTRVLVLSSKECKISGLTAKILRDYTVQDSEITSVLDKQHDGAFVIVVKNAADAGVFQQGRLPWMAFKGLGMTQTLEFIHKYVPNGMLKDYYGDMRCVDDYDIICTDDVFKLAGAFDNNDQVNECIKAVGADELYVCGALANVMPGKKALSRQMLSSAFAMTDEEIPTFEKKGMDKLALYHSADGYLQIARGNAEPEDKTGNQYLCMVNADHAAAPTTIELMQSKYTKQRNNLCQGKVPVNARYIYMYPDPIAWWELHAGTKKPDDPTLGCLAAGEICCKFYENGIELLANRSPHIFMEHNVVRNHIIPELMGNAVFFNCHDMSTRRIQGDYDGDHALVIKDKILIDVVKRINQDYKVPVLFYEALSATKTPIAEEDGDSYGDGGYISQVVDCVVKCGNYNLVAIYSNYATVAWSKIDKDDPLSVKTILNHLAMIARAVNAAVDAQKTFALDFIPEFLVDLYNNKVYTNRYRDAHPEHKDSNGKVIEAMPSDSPKWDEKGLTLPKGNAIVDRCCTYVEDRMPVHIDADAVTAAYKFNYKLYQCKKVSLGTVRDAIIPEYMLEKLNEYGAEAKTGTLTSFSDFMKMLWRGNAVFFKNHTFDKDSDKKELKKARLVLAKELIMDFVKQTDRDMEYHVAFYKAANAAAALAYDPKHKATTSFMSYLEDIFAIAWASMYQLNVMYLEKGAIDPSKFAMDDVQEVNNINARCDMRDDQFVNMDNYSDTEEGSDETVFDD